MNSVWKYFLLFVLTLLVSSSYSLEVRPDTITRQTDSAIFKRIYQSFGESATYLVGSEKPELFYSLSADGEVLGYYDLEKKVTVGWQLTRWPVEADDVNKKIYDLDMGTGFVDEQEWDAPHSNDGEATALGCLGKSPLRFSDIDGDGKLELVTYLKDDDLQLDWIIFSPNKQGVKFSVRLAVQDYFKAEAPTEETQSKFPCQYGSSIKQRYGHCGMRAYAKVFIDDFNTNGKMDIIVWRKRYDSLGMSDAKKGFILDSQVFNHYEVIDGEYKKQPTDSATIKNWLTTKQLTWQKGYPSKSECPGQIGQLIPEMHDPLLNDPDVLQ